MTTKLLPILTISIPEVPNKAASSFLDSSRVIVNGRYWLILISIIDWKITCKNERVQLVSLLLTLLALLKTWILPLCVRSCLFLEDRRWRVTHQQMLRKPQILHVQECAGFFVGCFDQYLLMNRSFNFGGCGGSKEEICNKNIWYKSDSLIYISLPLSLSKSSI